jgi:hypothetical protein
MDIVERLNDLPKGYHIAIGLLAMMIIGYVDLVTGYELRMELFYLVPISYATWFVGQRVGILFSFMSLVTIVSSDVIAGKKYTQFTTEVWNGAMYFVFYVIVTGLLKLRKILQQRESLIAELESALQTNEKLSGLLPVCANCKNIRNDEAYLKKVKLYIDKHVKAEFSRGFCTDCTAKLFLAKSDQEREKPSC